MYHVYNTWIVTLSSMLFYISPTIAPKTCLYVANVDPNRPAPLSIDIYIYCWHQHNVGNTDEVTRVSVDMAIVNKCPRSNSDAYCVHNRPVCFVYR